MKWPPFGYVRVDSLEALWKALEDVGPDGRILAGGQSLLATLAFRLSEPSVLIDITRIAALRGIERRGEALWIGALTRHAEIARDPLVATLAPLLCEAAPLIAHPAIRNRGTIGGSLALADPASEWPACAVALGATLVLASASGERRMAAESFFEGVFAAALEPGEIVAAIEVPVARAQSRQRIVEVARRTGDYAMAGLAAALTLGADGTVAEARLVYFGLGSAPSVATAASTSLLGAALSDAAILAAEQSLAQDLDPIADLHGGPEMKRHLARVLTRRALASFLPASEIAA
jgi:carbon-monoxide dehydrogenase medium subunit